MYLIVVIRRVMRLEARSPMLRLPITVVAFCVPRGTSVVVLGIQSSWPRMKGLDVRHVLSRVVEPRIRTKANTKQMLWFNTEVRGV